MKNVQLHYQSNANPNHTEALKPLSIAKPRIPASPEGRPLKQVRLLQATSWSYNSCLGLEGPIQNDSEAPLPQKHPEWMLEMWHSWYSTCLACMKPGFIPQQLIKLGVVMPSIWEAGA